MKIVINNYHEKNEQKNNKYCPREGIDNTESYDFSY